MRKREKKKITQITIHSLWLRRYFLFRRLCCKIHPYIYFACLIWNIEEGNNTLRIITYYVSLRSVIYVQIIPLSLESRPISHWVWYIWSTENWRAYYKSFQNLDNQTNIKIQNWKSHFCLFLSIKQKLLFMICHDIT